jgi:hypothetical protein
MSDERAEIGQILDAQGLRSSIRDGELIDGAVVILRIVEADGTRRVGVSWTDGLDWIVRRGLIETALDCERATNFESDGEDDE